ncbi:MAG: NAD-dependent epimerase/dehydratase family protein [Elusimicrobia bacterium]|nr:NAD-dependent epimerase/dehydratase family protein [Elusimicrobiota bacterium]
MPKALRPRRILVTGAAGFLAGPLHLEVRRRWPSARVTRTDARPGPGIRACDLLDPDQTRRLVSACRPDLVFHLAGTASPRPPDELWRVHVTATIELMEALKRIPGRARVVLSGSSAEYGAAAGMVTERAPSEPVTEYGRSKAAQTLAALSFRHEGLSVLVARIFNVSGPGIPASLAPGAFAAQISALGAAGGSILTGNLTPQRDYLDVRDVASALADIAGFGQDGGIYNVCSGRTVPMREILDRLIAASGLRIVVGRDPARRRPVDVPRLAGSHARLTALNGWKPRIPLVRSLADTLVSCRCSGR